MTIMIRRQRLYGQTWFEIMDVEVLKGVFFDIGTILAIQERGHEIVDVDAVLAEQSRWN